jgi:DNA repair protein RecO
VRAICKGARRKAKAYENAIDLLVLGEMTFYERSAGLNILRQFSTVNHYQGLRGDIGRYEAALACLDFIRRAAVENQAAPLLFDLFREALEACSTGPEPWTGVYAFMLGGLREAGFAPSLDACGSCAGDSFPHGPRARTAVSFSQGGLLCMKCGHGQKVEMWLSRDALDALNRLAGAKPREVADDRLEPAVARDVRAFLRRYCEFTFERPFLMLKC